jgi:plastocyanin
MEEEVASERRCVKGSMSSLVPRRLSRFGFVLFLCILSGCSRDQEAASREPVATPVIDPQTAGYFNVSVQFSGTPPEPKAIVMRSAPQCAKLHEEPVYDRAVVVQNGRLANAVVWVEAGLEGLSFPPRKEPMVIDQKGCLYTPRVAVVTVGQPVEFRNSDPEPHNVHIKAKANRGANFMLNRTGTSRSVTFTVPEVAVTVGCDVHPWMVAHVVVLPHPFGAVTNGAGSARIGPLPPGEYTVAVWHEVFGKREQRVRLEPRAEASVEFHFGDG